MAIKSYANGSREMLSSVFSVAHFACHGKGCCSNTLVDEKLVDYLRQIREHFGQPLYITSAYRCAGHNKKAGGATGSYHTRGQAADIVVQGVFPAEVAKYAESLGVPGIGLYETDRDGYFVHIDTRTTKSFWYGQAQAYRSTFGGAAKEPCVVELNMLKYGSRGEDVAALQILLAGRGYNGSMTTPDGVFGNNTKGAVMLFQTANGLTADGIVGAKTWAKLLGVDT